MLLELTEKDLEEGKKINEEFSKLSKEGKCMLLGYFSALQDKEATESRKGE